MADLTRIVNSQPVFITDDSSTQVALLSATPVGSEVAMAVRQVGTVTVTNSSELVTIAATSVTQPVSGTVTLSSQTVTLSSQIVTLGATTVTQPVSGTVTNVPSGTQTVSVSNTAAQIMTIAPTGTESGVIVRPIPSGTQPVSGTVTLSSQTVTVGNSPSVTIAATTVTQPVSGTITNVPSGTQPISGTITLSSNTVTLSSQTVTLSSQTVTVGNSPSVTIAATTVTQPVTSISDTSSISNAGTSLTPKYKAFGGAISGDNTLIPLVASKKLRVLSFMGIAAAAQSLYFTSGAAGTVIFGDSTNKISILANGGFVLPFNPVGWFETTAGVALIVNLSAASAFSGGINYVEV